MVGDLMVGDPGDVEPQPRKSLLHQEERRVIQVIQEEDGLHPRDTSDDQAAHRPGAEVSRPVSSAAGERAGRRGSYLRGVAAPGAIPLVRFFDERLNTKKTVVAVLAVAAIVNGSLLYRYEHIKPPGFEPPSHRLLFEPVISRGTFVGAFESAATTVAEGYRQLGKPVIVQGCQQSSAHAQYADPAATAGGSGGGRQCLG